MSKTRKISTCLWFANNDGAEAAEFYVSLFDDSRILDRSDGDTPLVVTFLLQGTEFMVLNGGPHFRLNEAASIVAHCEDQAEIDRLWSALTANGGRESQCGWLTDRWGVSWQIVPANMGALMASPDAAANKRAHEAMMGMVKLDIAALQAARAAA